MQNRTKAHSPSPARKPRANGVSGSDHQVKCDRNGFVRCRVCGCTEVDACANGCSGADGDLCSTCDEAVSALAVWFHDARRVNWAALRRETERVVLDETIPYRLASNSAADRAATTKPAARRSRAMAARKGGAR